MIKTPKVSMLIPIYGVEKFIERCAVSLFEQTYQNIEYIFVNDCTKDNSVVILKNVVERYPQRKPQVRIIEHETNKGLAGARNTAVAAATGEFVMHVDSDDYVDKDIVKKAILSQKKVDADIVIVDFKKAYPTFDIEVRHPVFSNTTLYCISVLERNIPNTIWGKLIRRRLYVDNSVCCLEGNNQGEDYQVLPKLYYYAKNIANLSQCLYYYDCQNEGAYSNSFSIVQYVQNWNSMNCIKQFFHDKEVAYRCSVDKGRLRQTADDFIISAKTNGEISKTYYDGACNILKSISRDLWNTVPLAKRVIFYLSSNYKIMAKYILMFRKIHHFALKIKSKKYDRNSTTVV